MVEGVAVSISRKDMKYIQLATYGAKIFSTCMRAQYCAILVDSMGHVVGMGYNGVPRKMKHCTDGGCPRGESKAPPRCSTEPCYAIHAEANAILHSSYSGRNGSAMYVNGSPCMECAKLMANSGVIRLVCVEEPSYVQFGVVRNFLETSGISVEVIYANEAF